jgi:GT2 family glycosyltransferase
MGMPPAVGIAVITRDRRDALLATLDRLASLPERPPIVVVDNASRDGTAAAVRAARPGVALIRSETNLGAGARTVGARALDTPVVAFADDDSWWSPGALDLLARAFAEHPRLGLVAARVLVGPEERVDPVCLQMRASPLAAGPELPGPRVLGFVACGSAVRREPFLAAGGFETRLGVGGEETLLSIDLAAAGWELCYLDDVVAHHHPGIRGPRPGRVAVQLRNALWTAWLRRPARAALSETRRLLGRAVHDAAARRALVAALGGAAWVARERRRVPDAVERDLCLLMDIGTA